ncbi:hypothetical protein [Acaryochloris sp. 'Moss Beach']|uniref:hypothetical protein n=1 Tax=Acaryochloris sp. 'Moss Beach' TaxID=2740837 RepID=UPI001F292D9C|nr:hypothetical protein [Acaryochloris sp. 'Moss Beach']
MALVKLANEQDRVLSVIRFESICFEPIQIHPKEDIDQMIRLLITSPTNGGTKFQAPLEKARDIIEQDADYSEVDIVFGRASNNCGVGEYVIPMPSSRG